MAQADNLPTKNDPDSVWINWHKALKGKYGKSKANRSFLEWWQKAGSDKANTSKLRDYAEKQGFSIEGGIIASVTDSVGGWVGGYLDELSFGYSFLKWVIVAVVIIVIAAVAYTLYNIAKNPNQTIKSAAEFKQIA